jgi:hypothetical protein
MGVQGQKSQHEQMVSVILGRKRKNDSVITSLTLRTQVVDAVAENALTGCYQAEK